MESFDTVVPVEQSNFKVKKELADKIADGTYNVGVLIAPQSFKATKLIDGEIKEEQYTVYGRKIPLLDIRKEMFEKHQHYMRSPRTDAEYAQLSRDSIIEDLCRIDEYSSDLVAEEREVLLNKLIKFERTRHLMFWHDGSNLANHSHILMTVSVMYDKAIFMTEDEYSEKFKEKDQKNIQAIIEEPFLYILSRCPADDAQLMYTATRCEDLELLKETILWKGVPIQDKMRLFKGDGPAAQFEAGQQKGGNFPCWGCSIHRSRISDYVHASNCSLLSLNDRVNKVLATTTSQKASKLRKTKLYSDLSLEDIILELHERSVKFSSKHTKAILQPILTEEMHGVQRIPALLFDTPSLTMNDLNMSHYEVSTVEPLHDIGNHIKNVYEEIPAHLTKTLRNDLKEVIKASFGGKVEKKTADYRHSLIHVVSYLKKKQPNTDLLEIFETLLNIQHILYMPHYKRTNQTILSLHIGTFKHVIAIKNTIGSASKNTKFYGKYFHALTRHATDYYRIVPGSTIHTEKEERSFTRLKSITNTSSNRHAQHVINNIFVRIGVSDKRDKKITSQRLENKISKAFQNLQRTPTNTIVSFQTIKKNHAQYQSLLESIADFLIEGNAYWEELPGGVEFFDHTASQNITRKRIHHFRSFTAKEEADYVKQCWGKCLAEADELIPANKIKVNEDGKTRKLKTLRFFPTEKSDMSISLTPLDNNLNLTPVVNEFVSLDIHTPPTTDISMIEKENHLSTTISTSPAKSRPCSSVMSSTPNAPKKSRDTEDEETDEGEKILQIVPIKETLQISSVTKDQTIKTLSNSALMLVELFGEHEDISIFDNCRKRLKTITKTKCKPPIQLQLQYKKITAKFEVKLKNQKERLLDQIKVIELNSIKENLSLSFTPTVDEEIESYNLLKRHLKYIDSLQREFRF